MSAMAGSAQESSGAGDLREADVVFNIVWTGDVFSSLRYFVASQMDHSDARFRFVANGCTAESLDEMRAFARTHSHRIVGIEDVSADMVAHGVALDAVLRTTDDGPVFALVDPDILANGPFVADYLALLGERAGVTAGREVWNDDNVVAEGATGVGGRHFWNGDGYVFGSPHFAVYRRAALDETVARWGVGFGSAGPDLRDDAKAALTDLGFDYLVYDTGKLVNVFLQIDGQRVDHIEHPALLHVGGMSHFLHPPKWVRNDDGELVPDWVRFEGVRSRHEVARFTAAVLTEKAAGRPAPAVPDGLDPAMEAKLTTVRQAVIDLVEEYREW